MNKDIVDKIKNYIYIVIFATGIIIAYNNDSQQGKRNTNEILELKQEICILKEEIKEMSKQLTLLNYINELN